MTDKSYSELINFPTFEERFKYLKLDGAVGKATFGYDRYLNQILYKSHEWRKLRDKIIVRDNGCDLGVEGFELPGRVTIHHINPITIEDILKCNRVVTDPDNLICVSHRTHNAIHYGDAKMLVTGPVDRTPNDTCPWKGNLK